LIEPLLPSLFECLHPPTILQRVRHVDAEANEVVAIENAGVPSVPFDALCLVAGGAEMLNDLEDGISQQLGWNVAAVVELEREQHLESPPPAAHSSPFPSR
jgi:hypothetical protein